MIIRYRGSNRSWGQKIGTQIVKRSHRDKKRIKRARDMGGAGERWEIEDDRVQEAGLVGVISVRGSKQGETDVTPDNSNEP